MDAVSGAAAAVKVVVVKGGVEDGFAVCVVLVAVVGMGGAGMLLAVDAFVVGIKNVC